MMGNQQHHRKLDKHTVQIELSTCYTITRNAGMQPVDTSPIYKLLIPNAALRVEYFQMQKVLNMYVCMYVCMYVRTVMQISTIKRCSNTTK